MAIRTPGVKWKGGLEKSIACLSLEDLDIQEEEDVLELDGADEDFTDSESNTESVEEVNQVKKRLKLTSPKTSNENSPSEPKGKLPSIPMVVEDEDSMTGSLSDGSDNDMESGLGDSVSTERDITVDPSIDAIIKSLEKKFTDDRQSYALENGMLATPLYALKEITRKYNERHHVEVVKLPQRLDGQSIIQVEIFVGYFRGVGESTNQRFAAQMAALDILYSMDQAATLPPFAFVPGWRIHGKVLNDLLRFCKKNGVKLPKYVVKKSKKNTEPLYTVELYVGDKLIQVAQSEIAHFARKLAAKNALETLTRTNYPDIFVAFGSLCLRHCDLVKMGYKPVMSDEKMKWLNEHLKTKSFRGVDESCLKVLQRNVIKNTIKNSTLTITASANDPRRVTIG